MSEEGVRAGIEAMRKCATPAEHEKYQPPEVFGRLFVAESLDPDDVIYFETCGLCAGFRRYITREEFDEAQKGRQR